MNEFFEILFPNGLYADAAAMYPPLRCAVDAIQAVDSVNPNSVHKLGRISRDYLEEAREKIAKCINAEPRQIGFTSSATQACEFFLSNWRRSYISPHEHKAVKNCANVSKVPGLDYQAHMLANNETGEIYTEKVKRLVNCGKHVFTDATAAVGHIPVDVVSLGVDGLAAGSHKFGGLPGIGFLYSMSGFSREPFPGTVPVFLAVSMADALCYRVKNMSRSERLKRSREAFEDEVVERIPIAHINRANKDRLPGISSIRFDGLNGRAMVNVLSALNVFVSAGAACSGASSEPSPVLMADGLTKEQAESTIRISLAEGDDGKYAFLADALEAAVAKLS